MNRNNTNNNIRSISGWYQDNYTFTPSFNENIKAQMIERKNIYENTV